MANYAILKAASLINMIIAKQLKCSKGQMCRAELVLDQKV